MYQVDRGSRQRKQIQTNQENLEDRKEKKPGKFKRSKLDDLEERLSSTLITCRMDHPKSASACNSAKYPSRAKESPM